MAWQSVIFQYDGSFNGFLCCIYDSYVYREEPLTFFSEDDCDELSFYPVRHVHTLAEHAQRVHRSLLKLSPDALRLLYRAFLTCMADKELHLYRFVRKLYTYGPSLLQNRADDTYYPLAKAIRHLNGELEKLRGFIRFSDYSGVLGAEIEPENRVLPLLLQHFCHRYANESFFIYDRSHKELLLYANGHSRIVAVDHLQLSAPDEEEILYRTLWRRFFQTVSIEARRNPRCQNQFLPKRYRRTMTEFLPPESPQAADNASFPSVSCTQPQLASESAPQT